MQAVVPEITTALGAFTYAKMTPSVGVVNANKEDARNAGARTKVCAARVVRVKPDVQNVITGAMDIATDVNTAD